VIIKLVLNIWNRKYISVFVIFLFFLGGCTSTSPDVNPTPKPPIQNEPDPEALRYFMEGQLYINQGNYAMAVVELQNALLYDENVSTIHLSLSDCYWMLKKPDLTISHIKKAISITPDDNSLKELLAKRFLALKEINEAEKVFHELVLQYPDSVKYILSLAELAKVQKNFNDAIIYYRQARLIEPQINTHLEKAVELALQLKDESLIYELLSQLISNNPNNIKYIENMVNISIAFGNIDQTIRSLNKMVESAGPSVELLNQLGLIYFNNNQPDSANHVFHKVLDISPRDKTSLHYLCIIFEMEGNYQDAEESAMKLIDYYPDYSTGYADLAMLYLNQNQVKDAIIILAPASDRFKSNFTIQFLTGLALNQSKPKTASIPFYERALILNPASSNTMHNLAILYDSIKQWTKSDSLYQILIKQDTTDAQAYNNYAYSLVERNENLEFALTLSRKAVQLIPESAAYLDTMGWILFAIGNNTKALDFIKQSVEIEDNNAVVLEHLGDVYKANNNIVEAKYYWNKAFILVPENEMLKKKLSASH